MQFKSAGKRSVRIEAWASPPRGGERETSGAVGERQVRDESRERGWLMKK